MNGQGHAHCRAVFDVARGSLAIRSSVNKTDRALCGHQARLKAYGLGLEVADAVLEWLSMRGYDEAYGARPLRQLIEQTLKTRSQVNSCARRQGQDT